MLIGGRRDCDLSIQHNDVSQVHCAVVNTGRDIIIADLCSRTGTFINEKRVTVATLRPADRLRVGSLKIDVQIVAGQLPRAAGNQDPTRLATPLRLAGPNVDVSMTSLPALIGRREACPVVIDTPDVSLAHALLLTIHDCPALFDLGSRSGTYLNGHRVSLTWLRDGDELSIGGVQLRAAWAGKASNAAGTAQVAAASAEPATVASQAPLAAASPVRAVQPEIPLNPSDDLDSVIGALQNHLLTLRSKLLERAMGLDQREAAMTTRADQITAESARFSQREAEIQAREQDIAGRLQELAQRELTTAETARRIEQFKAALNDASTRLTGVSVSAKRVADAPLVERPIFEVLSAVDPKQRSAS
jgi:pSer/pThr/pTyr-binding forkhead associated (FHA) protein